LIALIWGIAPTINKALLVAEGGERRLTPLQVALWGVGFGWLALSVLMGLRGRLSRVRDIALPGWLVLALMGFLGWSSYQVALNFAFTRLALPDAIFINYLHPVFVVLLQGSVFSTAVRPVTGWEQVPDRGQRPGPARLALSLLLCLLGVGLIATQGRLLTLGQSGFSVGALAALYAAFAWGAYSNLSRFIPVRAGVEARSLSDVHSFLAMTFGLVMLAAVAAARHELGSVSGYTASLYLGPWGPARVTAWALVAGLGVALYCGSYTLWLCALAVGERLGQAHKLPPLTYLTPAFAVVLSWLVLHEPFAPAFWQGAALIAAGNAVNVSGRRGED
jgi:drug/metabolite transporter (DMT)-like permease